MEKEWPQTTAIFGDSASILVTTFRFVVGQIRLFREYFFRFFGGFGSPANAICVRVAHFDRRAAGHNAAAFNAVPGLAGANVESAAGHRCYHAASWPVCPGVFGSSIFFLA